MVRVEIDSMKGQLYCPFCGSELVGQKEEFGIPCQHTLFMCSEDGGIEYCLPELDEDKLEEKIGSDGMDSATDNIATKNVVKFAMYEGAPSNSAIYVGIMTDVPLAKKKKR